MVAGETQTLEIASATHIAGDALEVVFAPASPPVAFKSGQHVVLCATVDGEALRRNYSICSGPGEPLRIAIKRVPGGRFSTWAHETLRAGMPIAVVPPAGRFVLAPAAATPRHIILFAAGSGITPCLGIVRQALLSERGTRVTLIYGNRSRESTLFADELEALKDTHLGRLELVHILSREGEAEVELFAGRITGDKVRALGQRLLDYAGAERIYVCGPGGMIKEVRDGLIAAGVKPASVLHEFFAPAGGRQQAAKAAAVPSAPHPATGVVEVQATLDDVRHRFTLRPGETLLAGALRAGLKAPHSCQGGMCATCRARVTDGAVDMQVNYSLEPWEIERGFVLTCQAVAKTPKVAVDWDAM